MPIVEIEVTRENIADGRSFDCDYCPIALAIARHVRSNYRVSVGGMSCMIGTFSTDLPLSATEFVTRFDGGCRVLPFTFTVDIPERYLC